MRDYKHYRATDGAILVKQAVWLLVAAIFAAIAYTSQADYKQCMEEKQSVVLCGGGNNK